MKLELYNSAHGLLDTIEDDDKMATFERALAEWAENLMPGDVIKVVSVKDEE